MNVAAAALAGLVALGAAWGHGYYLGGEHATAAAAQEAAQRAAEQADRAALAAAGDAARQAELNERGADLQEKVNRYAQTDSGRADCLDDDALQLFNAIGGHEAGVRAAPSGQVPGKPAAARRQEPR